MSDVDRLTVIERYKAEFDRMPHYGAEGCVCGNTATPDRTCPLHAANWIIERLEDQLRGAVKVLEGIEERAARRAESGPQISPAWVRDEVRSALALLRGQ